MTDTENTPVCRAQLIMPPGGLWDCALPEGHNSPHRDDDQDAWDIHYRPEPGHRSSLTARIENLEQTSASGAAVDDMIAGLRARTERLESALSGRPTEERVSQAMLVLERRVRDELSRLERRITSGLVVGAGTPVTLGSEEYIALLKDRAELHALRNKAQADTSVDDQHRANHDFGFDR